MADFVERDKDIKVFNTAKKFAEDILFPLMYDFKKFQRQANFGSTILNDAMEISEEVREIQRYNGLKGMAETVNDLLYAISSTVKVKGNKEENKKLVELIITTSQIKDIFYNNKDRFFNVIYKDMRTAEELNREYFDKIKEIINICYVNAEVLMTKNKILFADANDEYLADDEIKEMIRKEYIEN